jgi:hypothetical protein
MYENEEITVQSFNTPDMYAKEAQLVFLRNASLAAQEIVDIALGGQSERLRLDASKYVVDRVLGRIEVKLPAKDPDGKEPWAELYAAVISEPSAEERSQGKRPE